MSSDKVILAPHFGNIMNQRMVFKDFTEEKDPKCHLRPFMVDLGDNLGRRTSINPSS